MHSFTPNPSAPLASVAGFSVIQCLLHAKCWHHKRQRSPPPSTPIGAFHPQGIGNVGGSAPPISQSVRSAQLLVHPEARDAALSSKFPPLLLRPALLWQGRWLQGCWVQRGHPPALPIATDSAVLEADHSVTILLHPTCSLRTITLLFIAPRKRPQRHVTMWKG